MLTLLKTLLAQRVKGLLAALRRRVIGPHTAALVARTPNGLFAVDPEDFGVGRHLLLRGNYAEAELEQLRPYCNAQTRLLVVGAHVGTLAIPLARHVASVTAFEANPHTFQLLRMNLGLNDCTNCRIVPLAASDAPSKLEFLASRANSGGSKRLPQTRDALYYYDRPETISVDAVRLDDHLAGESYDVVIMDIEGSEYFALRGMTRLLGAVQVLQLEFIPHHLSRVAGVTVAQLVELLTPHFSRLHIPTQGRIISNAEFLPTLQRMFDRNEQDEGLLFLRT